MSILFFLSPKQDLMYVYDDFTLRQTLEKWENNRYASIPVLNRKGEYVGTLTEGDILWGLKQQHGLDIEAAEDVPISSFAHKRDYKGHTKRQERCVPPFWRQGRYWQDAVRQGCPCPAGVRLEADRLTCT